MQTNWANHEIIQTLMSSNNRADESIRLMAHILESEQAWLDRLRSGDAGGNMIWPDFDMTTNHRGQISKIQRQKGEEPVNTDYITYARSVTQR